MPEGEYPFDSCCEENENENGAGSGEELRGIVKQVARFNLNSFIASERFQADLIMVRHEAGGFRRTQDNPMYEPEH